MAGSYNKIILVGNLTRDPEIRYVNNGDGVTKFGLAVNSRRKNDETMFIDVIAWAKLGEICNTYLKKGMSVLIEGRLSIRKYDTKEGEKRTAIEVIANDMQMLDSRGRDEDGAGARNGRSGGSRTPADALDEELEDEIPF